MNEFSTQVSIKAPADDVFTYVTELSNLPEYLPTLHKATPIEDGRVRLQGEVDGKAYDAVGWYQLHEFNRTMLWGSQEDNHYSGDLEVMDQDDSCRLTINIRFDSSVMAPADKQKLDAHAVDVKRGLDGAGRAIKEQCEKAAVGSEKRKGYLS